MLELLQPQKPIAAAPSAAEAAYPNRGRQTVEAFKRRKKWLITVTCQTREVRQGPSVSCAGGRTSPRGPRGKSGRIGTGRSGRAPGGRAGRRRGESRRRSP